MGLEYFRARGPFLLPHQAPMLGMWAGVGGSISKTNL